MDQQSVLPDLTPLRTAVARACKSHDSVLIAETRRELREARLAEHIRSVVDTDPPLTSEQRGRLAILLVPEWALEAAASAPRISAADAGPLIAVFAAARSRITEAEQGAA